MKLLKKVLVFTFFISLSLSVSAQLSLSHENDFWNKVHIGGGLGLSFGNKFFSGSVSPSALYQFNEYIATGVGLNFTYSSINTTEAIVYGGSLLGILSPIRQLQLSAEFEQLRVNRNYKSNGETYEENYWYPALFVGAGYRQGPVTIGLRYDILYDENDSIYANALMPFVRVYF